MSRSISISELKRFAKCRLRWYWGSAPPRGLGLTPVLSKPALTLGRAVHEALQLGYDDRSKSFSEHYWDVVSAQDLDEDTVLFDDFRKKIIEQQELGAKMLEGYQLWSEVEDENYLFLATETIWDNVELPGTSATLSGVFDALVEAEDGLWILDFKTTSYRNTAWTIQDLQATAYTYAARKMYGSDVQGIIFRFMYKKAPSDYSDLILKSGKVTKKSSLQNVTNYRNYYIALGVATVMDLIKQGKLEDLGLDPRDALTEYREDETFKEHFLMVRKAYWEQLQTLRAAPNPYFWDVKEYRTKIQVSNYLDNVIVPLANDIENPGHWIGPSGLSMSWALCGSCPFREPCKMCMDGGDYQRLLDEEFVLSQHYLEEMNETDDDE